MHSQDRARDILALAEREAADAMARDHAADPPGFVYSVPLPWPPAAASADGSSPGSGR